ncbi:MAG: hypothetical protein ABI234_14420 [Ktedonobacteraceae bacterium]
MSGELNDFLARDWYGVAQVFCLRRRVEYRLKWTQEYVYGITSLTPKRVDPLRVMDVIRDHWSIENRLHYRRDVTLADNACQVRKGSAPHALAVLHSFVLALFDFCAVSNAKQQMRRFDAQPLLAARLLTKALGENEKALNWRKISCTFPDVALYLSRQTSSRLGRVVGTMTHFRWRHW